ncbi:MAG: PAS domain S-box protein [Rhodocyclaceae bacterium]
MSASPIPDLPAPPAPATAVPLTPWWYWAVPRIALLLAMAAVAALLWLLHRADLDEQRATLISDVLWVEQDLRFHLGKLQDLLEEAGRDAEDGRLTPGTLEARVTLLKGNNPWLVQLAWYGAAGELVAAVPPGLGRDSVGESAETVPSPETFGFARSLGKPVFSPPYPVLGQDYHVELHVPHFRDRGLTGMMVGIVSLSALLNDAVPWWYAQKYALHVVDDSGNVLAKKSRVEASGSSLSYAVAFDPPGRGLLLEARAYKTETNFTRNLLAAAIVALALGVFASLWALRRHVQRRYAAEAALRAEHAFRKAMEDSVRTGLRARDLSGRITYVNPAFCAMMGWSARELIGREPPMPYWVPEDMERTLALHRRILAGDAPTQGIELKFQRRDGERFDALIYEAPLIDAQGRQTGWMGSVLDISERKRAEELARSQNERLQFTSRLVTMGEMASSLAHEINQPLAAIASYATGCLNRLESARYERGEIVQALTKLGAQARRAGAIVRRIYDFVRRSEPRRAACDLNAIVEDALALVEADARSRAVRIRTEFSAGPLPVWADRVMIEQVVLNLVRNGIEAMNDTPAASRELVVRSLAAAAGAAVVVADRGCGIDEELAAKLFVPFFTTKPEGMGMGLNICRSIVEAHHGRIWCEPAPGGGTVFHVLLPQGPQP